MTLTDKWMSDCRPLSTETVSTAETNGIDDCSSPKMNKFLTREPPDGCEKIKIMTEDDRFVLCFH